MEEILDVTQLDLTAVWKHEANDFTPWLASESERLSEVLGLDLELIGTEMAVGPFSADIVFRDQSTGNVVVVENMFGSTDHDHLGKLITYAAGLGASYAVLVAGKFRPEHKSALHWLNAGAEEMSFFGVEVSAIKIGDSAPAAQLSVVVEPDDWSRQSRPEMSATQENYRDFWAAFTPLFQETYPGWSNARKPQPANWWNAPSGLSGARYELAFSWPAGSDGYRLRVGLYIDRAGEGAPDRVFDHLSSHRAEVEEAFGSELIWERLEGNRYRRVGCLSEFEVDPADRDRWPDYFEWIIDSAGRLRGALEDLLVSYQDS